MSFPFDGSDNDLRYQMIVDALPDLVYVLDRERRIVLINQAFLNSLPRLGLDGTPIGQRFEEVFPSAPSQAVEQLDRVFETGAPQTARMTIELNGEPIVADILRVPMHGEDGEVAWVGVFIREQQERHEAEAALREERDRMRAILQATPFAVTFGDMKARIVDCNDRAWQEARCESREDYLGRNGMEFVAPEDQARALENMVNTFQQGSLQGLVYTMRRVDGTTHRGELSAAVVHGAGGEPVGYVAVTRDLDECDEGADDGADT